MKWQDVLKLFGVPAVFGLLLLFEVTPAVAANPGQSLAFEDLNRRENVPKPCAEILRGDTVKVPDFGQDEPLWKSKSEVETRGSQVRDHFRKLVWQQGYKPERQNSSWSKVQFHSTENRVSARGTHYQLREFSFPSGFEGMYITGRILVPQAAIQKGAGKNPAIIYEHFHGGMQWLGSREVTESFGGFGESFVDEGYIVIATDVHGHGMRRDTLRDGKPGPEEIDYEDPTRFDLMSEFHYLWSLSNQGKSPMAVRTADDVAVAYLIQNHPLVDPKRVGSIGMSMGCVRSFYLSSYLGDELGAAVALGTNPDWNLAISTGKIAAHRAAHLGWGQTVPGVFDPYGLNMSALLVANGAQGNPLMIIHGDQDPSSPGYEKMLKFGTQMYRVAGHAKDFLPVIMANEGHNWTSQTMHDATAFLNERLQGRKTTWADEHANDDSEITSIVELFRKYPPDMSSPEAYQNYSRVHFRVLKRLQDEILKRH